MKKIISFLICALFLIVLTAFKPDIKPFEGDIIYTITYLELPEELVGMKDMLPNTLRMTLGQNKSKITQEVMGGSQVVIRNSLDKTGEMMMDMMGIKIHVHMTKEEIQAEEGKIEEPIVKEYNESKRILDYKCKKADLIGGEQTIEVWYTDKIQAYHIDFDKLKGFPLEYSTFQDGMKLRMTATKVESRKVPESEFKVLEGYTTYTLKELEEMQGGN